MLNTFEIGKELFMNNICIPVIIPSYEPDKNLIVLCENLYNTGITETIIFDDGSGHEYRNIFDRIESSYGFTVLRHAVNLGKGRALKDAFNYVLEQYPSAAGVITADSDGQHRPEDISKCMKALQEHPDSLILGCREFQGEQVPWKSRFGNEATRKIFRYLCGIKLSDTQTGLRGIPRSLMKKSLSVTGERFDYETNVLIEANGEFDFVEVPIVTVYDSKTEHKTHFDPFRDSVMIYKVILSFLLSSLLSVLIDFSIFSLSADAGADVWLATALGRTGSACVNFSVNRNAVFKSGGSIPRQLLEYLVLLAGSGTVSAVLVNTLSQYRPDRLIVIKAAVEGCLFFFNYYIQHAVIFRRGKEQI